MAVRGWVTSVGTATGVAAGAAAAQLGLGYGLGVLGWLPGTDDTGETAWTASLTWAVWIAATSTVLGAVGTRRLGRVPPPAARAAASPGPDPAVGSTGPSTDPVAAASVGTDAIAGTAPVRPASGEPATETPADATCSVTTSGDTPPGAPADSGSADSGPAGSKAVGPAALGPDGRTGHPAGVLWRVAVAMASTFGGLVTVVLAAVPARSAVGVDASSPQTVVALHAAAGVLIGLVLAYWALSSPAVGKNLVGTTGWLWLLAAVAVLDGVLDGDQPGGVQLGSWRMTPTGDEFWFRDYLYWPGAAVSLGSALLIGALAAWRTARQPASRVGATISGVAGPLLVAVATFLATPEATAFSVEQFSAQLTASYAMVAGLAGSALVAAVAQRRTGRTDASRRTGRAGRRADRSAAAASVSADHAAPAKRTGPAAETPSGPPTPGPADAGSPSGARPDGGAQPPGLPRQRAEQDTEPGAEPA